MICGPCVWPLVHRILLLTCFCDSVRVICPRPLAECVRRRRCHTGAGPWRAGCVREPSVRTTLLLLALTNTVLGGWHPHIVVVVSVHVVCITHRVDDSIAVAVSHACDLCFLLLFLFCLAVSVQL
ncbi:retrotransposon hot spot (RHS) protein [Trypanosoma cruzi]|nr:retrotransposon hot spot (RHS) protein [Trypanosoma cruzi]